MSEEGAVTDREGCRQRLLVSRESGRTNGAPGAPGRGHWRPAERGHSWTLGRHVEVRVPNFGVSQDRSSRRLLLVTSIRDYPNLLSG